MNTEGFPGRQASKPATAKGIKRKRLVKACDGESAFRASLAYIDGHRVACHKSKRRCDGTAPCGNCYFASKECTYSDSTGKPVPAPNERREDTFNPQVASASGITASPQSSGSGSSHHRPDLSHLVNAYVPSTSYLTATSGMQSAQERPSLSEVSQPPSAMEKAALWDRSPPAKRLRTDHTSAKYSAHVPASGHVSAPSLIIADFDPPRSSGSSAGAPKLPPPVTRELVNPPLSLHPLVRRENVRESGQHFANAALATLFDSEGRLQATGLEAAQALVLLQMHKAYVETSVDGELQLNNLALRVLHSLHLLGPGDEPAEVFGAMTPLERLLLRETARRTFWLIHLVEVLGSIFTKRATTYNLEDLIRLRLPLPCDETTFELALDTALDKAEFIDGPAPQNTYASEFGHVIRITMVLLEIERCNAEAPPNPQVAFNCEQSLEAWTISLADHLKYTPGNLQSQLSMWECLSNTSVWCFCFAHIIWACAVLALTTLRRRLHQTEHGGHQSALGILRHIVDSLGIRARNSILMGSVLWFQHCGPHGGGMSRPAGSGDVQFAHSSASTSSQVQGPPTSHVLSSGTLTQLDVWIKEWEELWSPATTTHNDGSLVRTGFASEGPSYLLRSLIALNPSPSAADTRGGSAPSSWNVPNVVIDTFARPSEQRRADFPPQISPALSSTSTSRGRDVPSLPSLKSVGLLDVTPDDALVPSSGASTPNRWSMSSATYNVSTSPRPQLLSPHLSLPGGSSSPGSASVSPLPRAPTSQSSGMTRLLAPGIYQPHDQISYPSHLSASPTFQRQDSRPEHPQHMTDNLPGPREAAHGRR